MGSIAQGFPRQNVPHALHQENYPTVKYLATALSSMRLEDAKYWARPDFLGQAHPRIVDPICEPEHLGHGRTARGTPDDILSGLEHLFLARSAVGHVLNLPEPVLSPVSSTIVDVCRLRAQIPR